MNLGFGLIRLGESWKDKSLEEREEVVNKFFGGEVDDEVYEVCGMTLLSIGIMGASVDPRRVEDAEDGVYHPGFISFTFTDGEKIYEAMVQVRSPHKLECSLGEEETIENSAFPKNDLREMMEDALPKIRNTLNKLEDRLKVK